MGLQEDTKELSTRLKAFSETSGQFLSKSPAIADATTQLAKAKNLKNFEDLKKGWSKKYKEAGSQIGDVEDKANAVVEQYGKYITATEKEQYDSADVLTKQYIQLEQETIKLNERIKKYNKELINPLAERLETHPMPNRDALHRLFMDLDTKKSSLAIEKSELQAALKKTVLPAKKRLKDESAQLEKLKFPLKGGKKK